MDISEIFWSADVKDIIRGYVYDGEKYTCLICGKAFEKGIIYKEEETYYEAEKYTKVHLKKQHGSMFNYLINMNKKFTGLSEVQKEVLMLFEEGLSDKEISEKTGTTSSTIRNHRFKLKEREKQSKIFLALMELLKDNSFKEKEEKEMLLDMHKTATTVDDRYNITEEEKIKTIEAHFDDSGKLRNFPAKEKKKIITLQHILKNFTLGRKYTEKELNIILKRIFDDYVTLRRALIEYGFMDRNKDCSYYWIKE
ncbi:DUF2087 domain-containing protein [Desnuesiella massiliensis]|uniref:DUF2087 domain-containing protein n=1 Tax=Desnuesiella massiliensis TaxID=1650662 RepID=UPI0006E25387|nr:DUF2087 domain-containing protein [Desnuesiella massiliensis]